MKEYWIWLSRLNIKPIDKINLLNKFDNVEKLYNTDFNNLEIEDTIKRELTNKKYKEHLDLYLKYMQKNNIKLINIFDKQYPEILKQVYDYPIVLYIKGNVSLLNNKSVAIVGSRNCSLYGKKVAKKLAFNLSKNNINIVSGLARGIDTFAHLGAIDNKSTTVAVLGCGIDIVYPRENEYLYNDILKNNGVVVSEYIMGTQPLKQNFPARNRIISGISNAVIVVEASKKSGSLITAEFALENGKDVYAVPRMC